MTEPKRIGVDTAPGAIAGATGSNKALQEFGTQTDARATQVTVGTSRTVLLPNNPRRIWWFVQNLSPNNGYLQTVDQGIPTTGILLGAFGGFASADAKSVGQMVTYEVDAIQTIAAGTWQVIEGFGS